MRVIRFFVPNSLDNFNHLAICPVTKEAAVFDPFDAKLVIEHLKAENASLTKILLTHGHGDHVRGVQALKNAYSVSVYGDSSIPYITHELVEGQSINVGNCTLDVLFTPGHTPDHYCFYHSEANNPFLICGDTFFNAGVGNTRSGNTRQLSETIKQLASYLHPETKIYPSHDYLCTNLRFHLSLNPSNQVVKQLLTTQEPLEPNDRVVTTLKNEEELNPFLMLDDTSILQALGVKHGDLTETFCHLRALRDEW